jgi:hypothetical protein
LIDILDLPIANSSNPGLVDLLSAHLGPDVVHDLRDDNTSSQPIPVI